MPTVLTCVFEGVDISSDASEKMQERAKRRGEKQRVNSGDADDIIGVGTIDKIDGGMMTIIFGSGDTKEINVMIWHNFSKELSCNKLPRDGNSQGVP